ncbi:MAG TPA: glycosyltransferase family 2 protein [Flavisolibacter sp.]
MKVTGFSFIKNAVTFQYPIVEAIRSILPICDEVVVAVGDCADGTRELVSGIDPRKIRIIDTVWDSNLKEGGHVLAAETDKALAAISPDSDWCVYIQGDEVMHEEGHEEVVSAMQQWKDAVEVDGLLFNYKHFYGSYDYIAVSSKWYRNEIRVIKNNRGVYSYRDAQGFRKGDNQKLRVKRLDAAIHHYGWVREPKAMQAKQNNFGYYYQNFAPVETEAVYAGAFDYSGIDALEKFRGTHPVVMQERIQSANWKFERDLSYNRIKLKDRFKNAIEALTGKRPFDHNNFIIV